MHSFRRTEVISAVDAGDLDAAVTRAVSCLRDNQVVAVPTETVYGLAARGLNADAVAAIYKTKGRPSNNPLILHVADADAAWPLFDLDPVAKKRAQLLADAFWPGPLTIVGTASALVPAEVRAGLPRVAVRVPSHPFARALATALGEPFAAPSANLSGRPSPTSARDVLLTLDRRISLVVDGGASSAGIESSVVDVSGERPRLLRPGAIGVLELRRFLPDLDVRAPGQAAHVDDASPGLRHQHYAPLGGARLVDHATLERVWDDVDVGIIVRRADVAGQLPPRHGGFTALLDDDAEGYAREIFAALYRAERA
ncbi:MAG TPA: L-threonylcarbamoyladenylate synthase, partial [Myxococcota bacterium]